MNYYHSRIKASHPLSKEKKKIVNEEQIHISETNVGFQ